jgi:TRAP-type C4-dicarboxylate transport system substrate-binding protein
MLRGIAVVALLAVAAAAVPGGAETARADRSQQIRIAMLAPRGGALSGEFKKLKKALRKATDNGVRLRIYPGGVAGDERDVISKMRDGQMEGAIVTTTGLSRLVPGIAVLDAPGLITSGVQLDAVLSKLRPEWEKKLLDRGVVTLGWAEGGRYRLFSKTPITSPADIGKTKPWLWKSSMAVSALWKAAGVKGTPLSAPNVYGALQTGEIDLVPATALSLTAMKWETKLDHVTREPFGILTGAFLYKKTAWDALPDKARQLLRNAVNASALFDRKAMRKADDAAFQMLLKQNYSATRWSPQGRRQWNAILKASRDQLVDRVFPAALLKRVQELI